MRCLRAAKKQPLYFMRSLIPTKSGLVPLAVPVRAPRVRERLRAELRSWIQARLREDRLRLFRAANAALPPSSTTITDFPAGRPGALDS